MGPDFTKRLKDLDLSVGIGEASRITGATATQIRYWEKKELVSSFRREEGGNKRFNFPNLARLMLVKSMIDEGYTLTKAADILAKHRHEADHLKMIAKLLVSVDETSDGFSELNFGQLQNDPDFDVVAKVNDTSATFCKVPRKQA